ncbi:MAG: extracellular factor (EF) 3-hydroxypalmitic acid methyl ester biosynthesis protein [Cocleimonas sp.]|jgi:extracellular factor (EF) 3-hydroxypalmitic acid methyl ester biosynthesis protein
MEVYGYLEYLDSLVKNGGPNEIDFEAIKNVSSNLVGLSPIDQTNLFSVLKPILNINNMLGYTFLKPYGYAGDFELISKIYTNWTADDPQYHKWDRLFHDTDTVKAIIKRKNYFITQVDNVSSKDTSPSVLNLGSGPCIDVFEYFQKDPRSKVSFECIDMDVRSTDYGAAVCDNYIDSLTFINTNVFSFKSNKAYDLIWSAGLFDYFNDKLFIILLRKYFKLLNKGGKLIVANFSENNSSRGITEVLCQWGLYHRSEAQLVELALTAGIPRNKIEIWSQNADVNLFLHISK